MSVETIVFNDHKTQILCKFKINSLLAKKRTVQGLMDGNSTIFLKSDFRKMTYLVMNV